MPTMKFLARTQPSWTIFAAFALFYFAALAFAQESPVPVSAEARRSSSTSLKTENSKPSPTPTSTAPAQTHTIQVGNGDHKFKPDVTQAEIGDIIEFNFYPQNHSVVRAEYEFPCIPYEMTGSGKRGFFSGFNPVDAVLNEPPKYSFRINDTDPIFFYCSAPGSCMSWGMVGVINPNSTTSLTKQRTLAQSAAYMLQPGEPFPEESPRPSNLPPSASTPPSPKPHAALSTGAIAGIVVACTSVVVLGALLFFFIGRSKTLKAEMARKASTIRPHSPASPSGMFQAYRTAPPPAELSPALSPSTYTTASVLPPAYFASPNPSKYSPQSATSTTSPFDNPASTPPSRSTSHRSVGGTFSVSDTTGYFTRMHDGADAYRYTAPHTADMTSPVDPKVVPLGAYGRQVQALRDRIRTMEGEDGR
ncbi:hypothetical protein BDV95DRAFT_535117 [Massariosphaeria phaeospora]|uniref:Cupredoxin n=1 Tax=Massariosphaeria phaeospora TaxID=100035 RepID=A0A7C8MG81_9PLEO|nr:hypothetical protein BDV95DRAFT_535117 [Massariosphaeria phaeospora]